MKKLIRAEKNNLSLKYPPMAKHEINANGSPRLNGSSSFDVGLFLIFIEEMGVDSNCPKLSRMLDVSELTCKNWIKKLREDCLCEIIWTKIEGDTSRFIVESHGIFNISLYDNFRPYIISVINHWRSLEYVENNNRK